MIDRIEKSTSALLDWTAAARWRQAALISLISLALLIPGLAQMPVTDRDEARFAQASKQMMETGDLIDIRFQDQPRWKKPVGIYWLQAGSASLFGGTEAPIWAYRLPSALAAWLAALFTLWAARPLVGASGATLAGAMMATALLMVAEGHIAKTDAALAASAAGALGGMAHLFFGRGGWGAALVFWLSIAASILLKGPIVPVIAIFALIALAWRAETRARMRRLHTLPGLALTALLVAPWLIAIWQVSGGSFFAESLGKDMGAKLTSGQEKHWGPPGLYLALVWITFWPWAAFLPQVAGWAVRNRRATTGLFLLAWLVPFWLLLEVVPTKLPHYVLPLYPVLAILIAGWVSGNEPAPRWAQKTGAILLAVPGVLIAGGVIALPWIASFAQTMSDRPVMETAFSPMAVFLAAAALVLILLAARAAWQGARLAQTGASLGAALLLYPSILALALPGAHTGFPSPALAAAVAKYRPCASGPAFTIGYNEPSLVFLTETALRTNQPDAAVAALSADPGALVLIEDRWVKIVGPLPVTVERASITYFNPNRGKVATARLLTPDDPRWEKCE